VSVNKFRPHVFILPEDDANRELALGFLLQVDRLRQVQVQVLRVAGGWKEVLKRFQSEHVIEMERWPERSMVLLIDFDGKLGRLRTARKAIPGHLADRVFVLGAKSKPEDLRAALGPYETIGQAMADDCRNTTDMTWGHRLLQHNARELERLRERVCAIWF
jgi:hypothetical protein